MTPDERRTLIKSLQADGDGLSAADLQSITDGGIMDPNRIYLPAGKLSEAEYRAREARILRGEAI